ncbi:hypothetical protein [Salarchaeum japonicum]|uniref:Uncharacterized protein n=1 Tax=Salarchaeum japonicum TaxID=555573 RepID=A0AAV3T1U2_9EURY|nr:hypothetical protein [Salarchaeum japonicum]
MAAESESPALTDADARYVSRDLDARDLAMFATGAVSALAGLALPALGVMP